jgi:hypothetical protein
MSIAEATSGQTSGISELFVQNYSDHVRLFGAADTRGVFRFSGLRAFGAFVLAGECVDGMVREVVIHSLKGGTVCLLDPWPGGQASVSPDVEMATRKLADGSSARELRTSAGVTYRLRPGGMHTTAAPLPVIEKRDGPREIHCLDWDDFDPPIVYYPEDPPFSQYSRGDRVLLGMPRRESSRAQGVDLDTIEKLIGRPDWQSRQTAARWLGRLTSEKATRLLVMLAESDEVPVVTYTAGVCLVRQATAHALSEALRIARETSVAHLRREILKAVRRLAHTADGEALLVECFSDLNVLEVLFRNAGQGEAG